MLVVAVGVLCLILVARVLYVMYTIRRGCPLVVSGSAVKTMVVLGSGGHTTEMLKMVAALDSGIYTPRIYLVAASDANSVNRLELAEQDIKEKEKHSDKLKTNPDQYSVELVPRAREVHQAWVSSCFTTLWSLVFCFLAVAHHRPTLVLANGPGTCVPVCLSAVILRILGLCHGRIVFVESICRVHSLSMSGQILYYLADHFFIQWPYLSASYPRAKHFGRLV